MVDTSAGAQVTNVRVHSGKVTTKGSESHIQEKVSSDIKEKEKAISEVKGATSQTTGTTGISA